VTNLSRESTVGKTPITRLRLRKPLLVVPTQRKTKFLAEMHTGIDLFLAEPEDWRKTLHLSAALGEAEWTEGFEFQISRSLEDPPQDSLSGRR
jgi:hypothetical protein